MKPLSGLKVIDLSRVLAGPYCGQLLGDLGADVLKIEGLEGDENRAYQPLVEGQSTSYLSVNRAKRGMTLDLKNPRGQETLHRLVEGVDVLIHNYRAGSVVGLGVAYETLIQCNPDLVYCSITGFGPRGRSARSQVMTVSCRHSAASCR